MFQIFVYLVAGFSAGVVTGLAGLSAAAIISPLLITLLGFPAFEAIGISLASDVLASGLSAATYAKNKHIAVRSGMWLLVPALFLTVVGCLVSSNVDNDILSLVSVAFPVLLGFNFLRDKGEQPINAGHCQDNFTRRVLSIISGAIVGAICGFSGAGGGMMMLFLLTSLLGYELKTAVGTSVFIMMFLALVGAISHFAMYGSVRWAPLVICALSALVGAWFAAKYANRADSRTLHRVIGGCLMILGIFLLIFKVIL
ncbi:MAG: sulfite exporter TauE/SafE family protein [Clostridiales bacterium]|nr:sulfite exporter TauE/SafE family protein [Clostridiales bacterium]